MSVQFTKLEATGNDFVVVDEDVIDAVEPALPVSVRKALCARHTGVGADGVLTILHARPEARALGAVYRMHITNPDGSVPEMCGNGLRCVARHLAETGRIAREIDVVIDTDAGCRTVRVAPDAGSVTIDMGRPDLDSQRQFPERLDRSPLSHVAGLKATSVSMGNPHVVIEADELPSPEDATRRGSAIELDRVLVPERTNVEWVVDRHDGTTDVDAIVWERGAGLTQACGTGACAVVAALVRHGRRQPGTTTVHLPGGPLSITVTALDAPVLMTGPVRRVFAGVFEGER